MINVIASISVKASERDTFIEIFKANVPKVLQEEGCVEYSATVDFQTDIPIQKTNANVVTVIEKWESLPQLEAHFTAPHMLEYKSKVEGMVEDVSLKILEDARPTRKGKTNHAIHPLIRTDSLGHSCQRYQNYTLHLQTLRRDLNPTNSLCEAMGGGKERVAPHPLISHSFCGRERSRW